MRKKSQRVFLSGTFALPLRLWQWAILAPQLIRNALEISPLAAGAATVERVRPFRCKFFSAALADPVLPFLQPPLLQILLISPVSAQAVIAILLAGNLCIEYPPTAHTYDFSHCRVRPSSGDFFLIPLFQRFLIFVFPITIPHGIPPPFMKWGGSIIFVIKESRVLSATPAGSE